MAKILVNATHGKEDAERATLPFVVGNVSATADQDTVVLLTIEGARLATYGYADDIHKEGFQPPGRSPAIGRASSRIWPTTSSGRTPAITRRVTDSYTSCGPHARRSQAAHGPGRCSRPERHARSVLPGLSIPSGQD